jgi:hypothetical protein
MLKQSSLVCSAALLLAVAACSNDSTGVSASVITQADANQLAGDMDNVSTLGTTDFGLGASYNITVDGSGASASAATSAQHPVMPEVAIAGITAPDAFAE